MVGSREESYLGAELKRRVSTIIEREVEEAKNRGYKRSRSAVLRMLLLKGVEEWEKSKQGKRETATQTDTR